MREESHDMNPLRVNCMLTGEPWDDVRAHTNCTHVLAADLCFGCECETLSAVRRQSLMVMNSMAQLRATQEKGVFVVVHSTVSYAKSRPIKPTALAQSSPKCSNRAGGTQRS
jgi:hypothetical protein